MVIHVRDLNALVQLTVLEYYITTGDGSIKHLIRRPLKVAIAVQSRRMCYVYDV